MNAEEFINMIKLVVVKASIEAMGETMDKPAGRNPAQDLLELSGWYKQLNDENKTMVLKVIKESVEMSVFGFLCVLDGVTAIENEEMKGTLSLHYEKNNTRELINHPDKEYLHNLFR